MRTESTAPFETIESAQEFLALLAQVVSESRDAVAADVQMQAQTASPKHIQALDLIVYKLDKLSSHLKQTRRILNDLRMLRRLLHQEKAEPAAPGVRGQEFAASNLAESPPHI